MRKGHFAGWLLLLICSLCLLGLVRTAACQENGRREGQKGRLRTIGEVTWVSGLGWITVRGVGLVVGLDGTGGDPAPGPERAALLHEMQQRGVRHAERVLRSPNTALVRLRADIPPGIVSCRRAGCWCVHKRKGDKERESAGWRPHLGDTFDVEVEVPQRDATASLDGGWLLEAWLYETTALPGAGVMSGHVWGRASGPVMVLRGAGESAEQSGYLRRGRVLGGGVAVQDRELTLVTGRSFRSARWTMQIANRINARFRGRSAESKPFAEAHDPKLITLRTPPRYRHNVGRFLEVVGTMPVFESPAEELKRIERLGGELMVPATAYAAAIQLEGIGRRVASLLKKGLESQDPDVRFFSAEALAYLGHPASARLLGQTARDIPEYRAHALTALSALDAPIARMELEKLMSHGDSVELRYGAFRALRAIDELDPAVGGWLLADNIHLHHVDCADSPFVHATTRGRAELVVFGHDLKLVPPLLLRAGQDVLVTADAGAKRLRLTRFEVGQPPVRNTCSLDVLETIRGVAELGATYPQIAAMLAQADRNHNLPGRFVLDQLPDPDRMYVRLRRIARSQSRPRQSAMPSLFRWRAPKKRVQSKAAPAADLATEEQKKAGRRWPFLHRPGFIDKLLGRSAN